MPVETAFAAVTTIDGLRGWWAQATDGSPEPGGDLRFDFPGHDSTTFMRVDVTTKSAAVQWTCTDSDLREWAGTSVSFGLTQAGSASTEISFTHTGLQPALECYDLCSAGWDYYLRSLGSLLETGTGQPYPA